MANIDLVDSEELGWFGLTWPEKVGKNAKKYVLPNQGNMINTRLVNNIHQRYLSLMTKGFGAANFTSNMGTIRGRTWTANGYALLNDIRKTLNVELIYIDAVLRSLYELAVLGKIPYSKLDPKRVISDDLNNKIFKQNKLSDALTKIGLLGGAVIGGILLFNKKKRGK